MKDIVHFHIKMMSVHIKRILINKQYRNFYQCYIINDIDVIINNLRIVWEKLRINSIEDYLI
jgi:hypothetical protein